MNKHLIESANEKGYVVRDVAHSVSNDFGFTNLVVIQGGQYTISFITNVLHGVNYFNIIAVKDYLNNRMYFSNRYHIKFISLISEINGNTHIKLKGDQPK